MLIGIGGKAGAGKSTVAEYLLAKHAFKIYAFADPLKEMLLALNPLKDRDGVRVADLVHGYSWDYAKKYPEVRRLLQRLGTEAGREILGEHVWVQHLARRIIEDGNEPWQDDAGYVAADVVVPDVRFQNEKEWIKVNEGYLIYVNSPLTDDRAAGHASETSFTAEDADIVINNNGTHEDLYEKIDYLMERIG